MTIAVAALEKTAQSDFWGSHGDFWVSTFIGVIGLGFTVWAVIAATGAKRAANRAARSVKMQSVAIELMDIAKELGSFDDQSILYPEAREFMREINFKLRRLIAPFQDYDELGDFVASIRENLTNTQKALSGVKPVPGAEEAAPVGTVYNAIEGYVAIIGDGVADLVGLMHTAPMNIGRSEAKTE
jgi:hypothetical protein